MDKASHFDMEALVMLEEIMEDEFPELVNVFITDSDPRIEALKNAFNEQDFESLREMSHSFKGASGNLSALPLANLCFSIESKSRARDLGGMDVLIKQLETEYIAVKNILNTMI